MAKREKDQSDLDFNHFDHIPLQEVAKHFGKTLQEMAQIVLETQKVLEEVGGFGLLGLMAFDHQLHIAFLHGPNGLKGNHLVNQQADHEELDELLKIAALMPPADGIQA